ncbi:MAG: TlpA family protein disulfide reductase [Ignavibacteria bacterium]|nr:TlpA family protein disulfide reductase [Ignavibacteria bacterium]
MKRIRIFSVLFFAIVCYYGTAYSQDVTMITTPEEMKAVIEANKGSVILVNFWATWCPPCVKEFPDIMKLNKEYSDKGLKLIFVSLDDASETESKLKPFLQKQGVDFVTYQGIFPKPEDLTDVIDKSWGGEIPVTYFYDKEGKKSASFSGSKKYEEFEKEVLKLIN